VIVADLESFNLLYLATPYTKYPGGIEVAFRDACAFAGTLLKAGLKIYSPIVNTHPIAIHGSLDPLDYTIWLPFDHTMMRISDAILVAKMPTWEESYGIEHEIGEFRSALKPVFFIDPATLDITND